MPWGNDDKPPGLKGRQNTLLVCLPLAPRQGAGTFWFSTQGIVDALGWILPALRADSRFTTGYTPQNKKRVP